MLRWFVAVTPLAGAILYPLIVPIVIAWLGIAPGVFTALILSIIWFVAMLITAEMPH